MSSNLLALLERINAKKEEAKPVEKPPESPYLLKLIGRIEAKKWRDEAIQETLARLEGLQCDLEFIRLAREDETLMAELALDIERYAGSKSGIWYLDLSQGEDILPEYYADCPKAEDYNFGSYWDRTTNYEEIKRFILDRMKWAEPLIQEEIYTTIDFYLALEEWDLESPLPPYTSDKLLLSVSMERLFMQWSDWDEWEEE